jgi:hypothetical protein
MYREVICITGIDVGAHVGAHEETLVEENALVTGLAIGGGTLCMEMVEMQVCYVSGIRPAAESLYKAMGNACDAAEVYVAV